MSWELANVMLMNQVTHRVLRSANDFGRLPLLCLSSDSNSTSNFEAIWPQDLLGIHCLRQNGRDEITVEQFYHQRPSRGEKHRSFSGVAEREFTAPFSLYNFELIRYIFYHKDPCYESRSESFQIRFLWFFTFK